jgi:hypothetical protein
MTGETWLEMDHYIIIWEKHFEIKIVGIFLRKKFISQAK